jgi:opacity protein-like surface antigen
MKTVLIAAAAAVAFVTPAAAQPTAAPAPAATCTPEHAAMGHCTLPARPSQPQSHQGTSQGHAESHGAQVMDHGQMSGCCRDANGNGKMDCCENMGAAMQNPAARQAPAPQPQAHQGH